MSVKGTMSVRLERRTFFRSGGGKGTGTRPPKSIRGAEPSRAGSQSPFSFAESYRACAISPAPAFHRGGRVSRDDQPTRPAGAQWTAGFTPLAASTTESATLAAAVEVLASLVVDGSAAFLSFSLPAGIIPRRSARLILGAFTS